MTYSTVCNTNCDCEYEIKLNVAPEGSKYTSPEAFDERENKLQLLNDNDTLCGVRDPDMIATVSLSYFNIMT
jgi:hypothetical protein